MEFKIGKSIILRLQRLKNENRKKAENPRVIKHELKDKQLIRY